MQHSRDLPTSEPDSPTPSPALTLQDMLDSVAQLLLSPEQGTSAAQSSKKKKKAAKRQSVHNQPTRQHHLSHKKQKDYEEESSDLDETEHAEVEMDDREEETGKEHGTPDGHDLR